MAEMVWIEGGTFMMGSPANEPGRYDDEIPHQVTVSGFYMGKYTVTWAEYDPIMGTKPGDPGMDNLPAVCVSWYEAVEYCNKLSRKEGLSPAYTIDKNQEDPNNENYEDLEKWIVTLDQNANGYRLPTEAEWEYACRAGTTTPFNTGKKITTRQANYGYHYGEDVTPVGSFPPNAWGLYDMHGNVREWCWDWHGDYSRDSQTNPLGPSSGSYRVERGGCYQGGGWKDDPRRRLRSACRFASNPSDVYANVGFRVARNGA